MSQRQHTEHKYHLKNISLFYCGRHVAQATNVWAEVQLQTDFWDLRRGPVVVEAAWLWKRWCCSSLFAGSSGSVYFCQLF